MTDLLPGTITPIPPGIQGFDTDTKLTSIEAGLLQSTGFVFCLRYLTRRQTPPDSDLTHDEAQTILASGLGLMAVQHVANDGWHPTATLGIEYATNAVHHAQSIGLPPGLNIWLDLEGCALRTSPLMVIAYCNNWFDNVSAAGYVPGLYVGYNSILSGDDLFYRLRTKHYWKSASRVPDISHRGYQMVQGLPHELYGVPIDANITKTDNFGGQALMLQ